MTELLYDIPESYSAEALALGAILKAPPKNTRQTRRTSVFGVPHLNIQREIGGWLKWTYTRSASKRKGIKAANRDLAEHFGCLTPAQAIELARRHTKNGTVPPTKQPEPKEEPMKDKIKQPEKVKHPARLSKRESFLLNKELEKRLEVGTGGCRYKDGRREDQHLAELGAIIGRPDMTAGMLAYGRSEVFGPLAGAQLRSESELAASLAALTERVARLEFLFETKLGTGGDDRE